MLLFHLVTVHPLLLPTAEAFCAFPAKQGFRSTVWHVNTASGKQYIYRYIPKSDAASFSRETAAIVKIAQQGLGPRLLNYDIAKRAMLIEYVSQREWPAYATDRAPYVAAMIALRKAHQTLSVGPSNQTTFAPFSCVTESMSHLKDKAHWLPEQFFFAADQLAVIETSFIPWLQEHATLCHGDFHRGNVLLGNKGIALIDWTDAVLGHPFFDIAKFTLHLDETERFALLESYLGHPPSLSEKQQFFYVDLALLLVIAANRFHLASKEGVDETRFHSKQDLEELLTKSDLPSFLTVNFSDNSPKARQYAAICALQEFLKRLTAIEDKS